MRGIEKELQNRYNDYEELLKRKRDEEQALADQTVSVRRKLGDRKKQIKEAASHFSEEDLKNLRERAFLQLQTLESVYEEERRRQHLLMSKRVIQRKMKLDKQASMKQKAKQNDVDTIKSKLLLDEKKSLEVRLIEIDEEHDNELLRKLREWMRHRQELKAEEEMRLLGETVLDVDATTLRKLITKLDNLEKSLRELRKLQGGRIIPVEPKAPEPKIMVQQF